MYKKHILVLGLTGQVAQALYQASQNISYSQNFKFTFLDRNQLNFLNLNLYNLQQILLPLNVDIIINAVAYTNVDKAQTESEMANIINYLAVKHIAKFCQLNNIFLVHYSTDYIFDGKKKLYTENDTANPLNIYGKTKYLSEQAIVNNLQNFLILRTSWIYDNRGKNFVLNILNLAKQKQELNIINDQFGSPTWAYTIADTTLNILNTIESKNLYKSHSGIYHLTSNDYTTWYNFALTIFTQQKIFIKINPISSIQYKSLALRPQYSILCTDKICATFNIELPAWQDCLHKCLKQISI